MERDCCKFICGAPTTFQGYGIEWRMEHNKTCAKKTAKMRAFVTETGLIYLTFISNFAQPERKMLIDVRLLIWSCIYKLL